ncbi:MAG: class I adenylate-forming enzyme family protein [Actinomycetaceae bacterium]|nr:class I adenylate-forming enzyme family protein [Actinomycetaceae bacterium]
MVGSYTVMVGFSDKVSARFNPAHSLDLAASAHPQRVSLWYGERSWSVLAAAQQTLRLAQVLVDSGVRRGDRVAIIARNSPYHLLLYVALARIGAVFVPISYRLTRPELMRVLVQLTPRALVVDPETAAGVLREVPRELPDELTSEALAEVPCGLSSQPLLEVPCGLTSEASLKAAQELSRECGEAQDLASASAALAGCTAGALFVIDDDAQAQLPASLAPDPLQLNAALTAGWRGLSEVMNGGEPGGREPGGNVPEDNVYASVPDVTADEDAAWGEVACTAWLARSSESEADVEASLEAGAEKCLEVGAGGSSEAALKAGLNNAEYPEGLGAILLTSGSEGEPKLVPLSYENLWWGSRNFREGFEYSNLDVELVVAPLTHIGGFNGTTADLFSHGGTVVVVREFQPSVVVRELERRRVAIMFGVPTMYTALMQDPHFVSADLRALRLPLTGGAPASAQLLHELDAAGLHVLNVWGMTETSASGCYLPAEQLGNRAGSIGRPFAHVQARIVDLETGCDAAGPQPRGELWLRGPNVVTHYWRRRAVEVEEDGDADECASGGQDGVTSSLCQPDADQVERLDGERLKVSWPGAEQTGQLDRMQLGVSQSNSGKVVGSSAWLRTGDVVRMDSEGYLWVIGRVHELINTGGEKVAPHEVMQVVAEYPGVLDAAVVGVPDPVWGEVVTAVLIMAPEAAAPSLQQLRAFAARSLADFKLPRAVRIVERFPLNGNGKIDRVALVRLLAGWERVP